MRGYGPSGVAAVLPRRYRGYILRREGGQIAIYQGDDKIDSVVSTAIAQRTIDTWMEAR